MIDNHTQAQQLMKHLKAQLPECMGKDRFPLQKKWLQLQSDAQHASSHTDGPFAKKLASLMREIEASQTRLKARQAALPKPEFADNLPVNERRHEIAQAISQHQVVIICGETGSGKTTQLPKICLELGRGVAGLIGHTQPRRIAARSVASRIAQELKSPLGQDVGYKVRFNDKLSESSYIKLMTDGILLSETQGDRFLNAYDTLIIDEAHERSLNIDFLLGYIKQILPKRPDLKVIITSATIDADRFAKHFSPQSTANVVLGASERTLQTVQSVRQEVSDAGNNALQSQCEAAPVIEVSGRTYPVEIRYRPLQEIDEDEREEKIEEAILDAVDDLSRLGGGDILVFLPGEREIRDTAEHLRKHHPKGAEILPLFARLSIEDQQKIFKPSGGRRIVLATNVAETSLTVPGIKYVIDTGLARVKRYSARSKVEQLQIEKISQAAAKQRAGRCGRVSNGICVRLYSEQDFNERPAFTDPEIIRSSLAAVILRMAALRLGDVSDFPFIEPPSSRLISDGYLLLQELGAVDARRHITPLGQQMAKLPLDPRVARMILAAQKENCLHEILIIASVLSIQDPRERPMDKREAADLAHAKFADERSDFMGYLKLWEFYDEALKHKKSNRELLNKCHANFLSFLRLKEWRELHGQIASIVGEMEFKSNTTEATYEQIHRALLAGLLGNIGFKDGEAEAYLGARGIRFHIAPGTALKKSRPKWVMAAELVDTAKLYARCVAKIEPDWIEPLARGLTESSYTDPRWDRRPAQVFAWERVSLYGLTVVPKRRVHYGAIHVAESREIFIREALANMEFDTRASFFEANKRLIAEVEELEHKARRQDVLVDEQVLFDFYDAIVPAHIVNGAGFEKWRQEAEKSNPKLLYLTKELLMRHAAQSVTEVLYPETMLLDGVEVPLKYRFELNHPLDGVTATVPLTLLNQLNPTQTEWLVPGMIREKLTQFIKALPKSYRRVCVPVPDFVTAFLEQTEVGSQPLLQALSAFILKQTSLKIGVEDWPSDLLPAHMRMNFRIVDDAGLELAMGRDWQALKQQLGQMAQLTFREGSPDIEKAGLKQWDFGDLPSQLNFSKSGQQLTGYPAVEDNGESVSVKLFDTEQAALIAHRKGVCRLMRFELKEQMKQLEKGLPGFNQFALQLRNLISPDDLREEMLIAIADRAFIGEDDLPYTNQAFMNLKARARSRLPAVVQGASQLATQIAAEYTALQQKLSTTPANMQRIKKECEQHLALLLPKHFMTQTPWTVLQHMPRYLKAIKLRLEKYPNAVDRDARHAQAVQVIWQRWEDKIKQLRKVNVEPSEALTDYRWMIEELRVSLFAQELKTPYPVSAKRLDKIWTEI